jgi:hypothetical protein
MIRPMAISPKGIRKTTQAALGAAALAHRLEAPFQDEGAHQAADEERQEDRAAELAERRLRRLEHRAARAGRRPAPTSGDAER